jgi:UDP-glucose 4-epimerase
MANYLVTGGCGFIGSHLIENLLNDGHHVRILDDLSTGKRGNVSTECEIVIGDVSDSEQVRKSMQGMNGCFHLAAISSVQKSNEEWARTHEINQGGTINVLDAAKTDRIPVIYASSAAVFGDNAEMPLNESSTARPLTGYGADKLGSEHQARVASVVHGVPTAGMRFFNVYGSRQDPSSPYSGVISIFVDRILEKKNLTIYGDGEQTRDFVYVKDVVAFLRAAMENVDCNASVYNVCTGKAISVNQLAKTIMSITGNQILIAHKQQRAGDIRVSVGDPSFSGRTLGVTSKQALMNGLREYIEYVIENKTAAIELLSIKMMTS